MAPVIRVTRGIDGNFAQTDYTVCMIVLYVHLYFNLTVNETQVIHSSPEIHHVEIDTEACRKIIVHLIFSMLKLIVKHAPNQNLSKTSCKIMYNFSHNFSCNFSRVLHV